MSFLDIYNQQGGAAGASTFTDQAKQIQQALSGKAPTQEVGPSKTNLQEQAATAQVQSQQQNLLGQAQAEQDKATQQSASISQQQQFTSEQYAQKKDTAIAAAQRQFNAIHQQFAANIDKLDEEKKAATLDQLSFLQGFVDRKYADMVVMEGDKRRLDEADQMRTAQLYATFNTQVDMLNKDVAFKEAVEGEDRKWNEYLATIDPEAAIQSALISYRSEQSQRAGEGMTKGIVDASKDIAYAYKPSTSPTSTNVEAQYAAGSESAPVYSASEAGLTP